jgi:glycine oxidase
VALIEENLAGLEEAYVANKERGIPVERPTAAECQQLAPGLSPRLLGALFLPGDAWVDNTALTLAMVKAAEKSGAIFERGQVQAVVTEMGKATGVTVAGNTRTAGWIVLAAGCWSGQIDGLPPLPVQPVRGQAFMVAGQPIRRIVMSPRGYLVPKGDHQTMVGATVERVGFDDSGTLGGIAEVAQAGLEMAPRLAQNEFLGAWSGLRPGTPDDLPFIGPFASLPNVIAATGHFRNGILLAPITAAMVQAALLGETPPLALDPFLPGR